jgi:hypothetical protein
VGAEVTPFFPQDHGDIPDMTHPQARVRRPQGSAALPPRLSGHPGALVILVRHMGHAIFERFLLHGLPRPGDRQDQAPAARPSRLVPVLDQPPVRLRALGRLPTPNDQRGPPWGYTRAHHLAQQGMCTAIPGVALGQHEPQAHRDARAVPGRHQPPAAQAQKPGMLLTDPPLLRHRILGAALVGVAAITKQRQEAVRRCGQGGHEILRQPAHEERHVPGGGFAQAPKAPRGDDGGCPPGPLFQRFAPRVHGLHADEPAEDEAMAPAPYGGHAAKDQGHKARERGEGDQPVQCPLPRRERAQSYRWKGSCRLYTFSH